MYQQNHFSLGAIERLNGFMNRLDVQPFQAQPLQEGEENPMTRLMNIFQEMGMRVQEIGGLENFLNERHPTPLREENLNQIGEIEYTIESDVESDVESCTICQDEFMEKCVVREMPCCKKLIHKDCIDRWFEEHQNCVLCRTNLNDFFEDIEDTE